MEQNELQHFQCIICLMTVKDAVVTICGHLFCWPCLNQWFLTWPNRKRCPLCRRHIDENCVIWINAANEYDPPLAPWFSWISTAIRIPYALRHLLLPVFFFILFSQNFEDPSTTPIADEDIIENWKLLLYMFFPCIGWMIFT